MREVLQRQALKEKPSAELEALDWNDGFPRLLAEKRAGSFRPRWRRSAMRSEVGHTAWLCRLLKADIAMGEGQFRAPEAAPVVLQIVKRVARSEVAA
jgi:hypothetical protein